MTTTAEVSIVEPGGIRHAGGLVVDTHRHTVRFGETEVELTCRECEILEMLAEHPGWVYSPEQLAEDPVEGEHSAEAVSVLVARIRHKLAEAGADDVVQTVRGFGYRLRAEHSAEEPVSIVEADRTLRDAAWRLHERIIELEHRGTPEQHRQAAEVLDDACDAIDALDGVGSPPDGLSGS